MNEIQQLREWAQLANIPSETVSEQGDLIGFFQNFRPYGERLESVFAEHVLGQEVMDRVKECFSATANGENDAYFIPRRSESAVDEASALLKAHFKDLVSIAKSMKDQELVDILFSVPLRQVQVQEFNAIRPTDDTPDGWIFDMITDYTTTLTPVETPLLLLKDAVYSIANDKLLQQYILWPIYRESSLLVDPYRSYFAVWSMGIRYAIPAPETCLFCV